MLQLHLSGKTSASPGKRVEPRSAAKKILAHFRGDRGQSLVEFALVFPLLITVVMAIVVFGAAYGNYQTLTNAAAAGAQALSISRGNTTNPCTTVTSPAFGVSPYLSQSNLKFTIIISPPSGSSGTTYTLANNQASPTCQANNTTSAPATDVQQYYNASVTITYPCQLSIFGVNFAPNCLLTAQTSEAIQ